MKTPLLALAAVGLVASASSAALIPFNFPVLPSQEVPPNNTNAVGAGQLLYDTVAHTFDLDVTMFGINIPDITGYHIHNAPFGVNGPIVINLQPLGNWMPSGLGIRLQLSGVPISTFEPELFAGNLYFNVHTNDFPNGQARGQIIPAPATLGALAAFGLFAGRRRRK